jgi:hypothetical protein
MTLAAEGRLARATARHSDGDGQYAGEQRGPHDCLSSLFSGCLAVTMAQSLRMSISAGGGASISSPHGCDRRCRQHHEADREGQLSCVITRRDEFADAGDEGPHDHAQHDAGPE